MSIILIVEDDNSVRELLRIILTPEYQVVEAVEVSQAIELAQIVQPDLILLDLNLRRQQDGLTVCRTLRSDPDPVLARVPIVILTGETGEADIKAALAAGADSYVNKPYSPNALLKMITILLAKEG